MTTPKRGRPKKPDSQAAIAVRLSEALGMKINRDHVKDWISRGWDLDDIEGLRHKLRQRRQQPKKETSNDDDENFAADITDISAEEIPAEISKLESALIAAPDFETARTISTKLAGLKNAFRLHCEMGQYITKESVERDALRVGHVFKQMILKIPAELPQMIIGLEYAEAVKRCEDYAYAILKEVSSESTYDAQ